MKNVFARKKELDSSKISIKLPPTKMNKSREEVRNDVTESFISKHKMTSA
jgi:hypothetical protein